MKTFPVIMINRKNKTVHAVCFLSQIYRFFHFQLTNPRFSAMLNAELDDMIQSFNVFNIFIIYWGFDMNWLRVVYICLKLLN